MEDILTQPATDVARMLRGRELSSRELTEAQLARIEAVNPGLNAVVELRGEQALAEAAAADEATARGGELGPLHGLPMTVKDSFDVAGLHTTWGNPAFADHVATADATVVRRLRRAGAVIVGKTNVAFMLGDFGQTANELHGVTSQPLGPGPRPGRLLGRRGRGRGRRADLPRVRVRPGRLDPHPGQLLRRLRAQAERRRRPPDRVPAARPAGRPERDALPVGGRAAGPVGPGPPDGPGRHRRPRGTCGPGLRLVPGPAAPHPAGRRPGRGGARPRPRPRLQRGRGRAVGRRRRPGPGGGEDRERLARRGRPGRPGRVVRVPRAAVLRLRAARRGPPAAGRGVRPRAPADGRPGRLGPLLRRRRRVPVPGHLQPSLPARPAAVRGPHDRHPRRGPALCRPGLLGGARVPARVAGAERTGRAGRRAGCPSGSRWSGPLYEDDTAISFAGLLGEVAGGYQPPPV